MAVDFATGHPRYKPEHASLSRIARGEIDAALIVGAVASLPRFVIDAFSGVPTIVIGPRASESATVIGSTPSATSAGSTPSATSAGSTPSATGARITIDTGVAGIHESGTAFRTDDLPLPLRALLPTPRDTASVLIALGAALATQRSSA